MLSICSRCNTCIQRRLTDLDILRVQSRRIGNNARQASPPSRATGGPRKSSKEIDSILERLTGKASSSNDKPAFVPGSRSWDPVPAESSTVTGRRPQGDRRPRENSSGKRGERPPRGGAHTPGQGQGQGFGLARKPRSAIPTHKPWEAPPSTTAEEPAARHQRRNQRVTGAADATTSPAPAAVLEEGMASDDRPVDPLLDMATDRRGPRRPNPHKRPSERGSILHQRLPAEPVYGKKPGKHQAVEQPKDLPKKIRKIKEEKVEREVFIPASVRVSDLARIVDVKLGEELLVECSVRGMCS